MSRKDFPISKDAFLTHTDTTTYDLFDLFGNRKVKFIQSGNIRHGLPFPHLQDGLDCRKSQKEYLKSQETISKV